MVIDIIISVFVETIGGAEAYYSLFALVFVIGTGSVFYKIST